MDLYKQHKEIESKVHEGLFGNLMLLSSFYPTTKDFDNVFRRDMFVKNNKTAFFEVIHYLLNILNPELTKKHLSNWPPYDLKMEAKFRNELIAYINTLNVTYENADIPACQASSLISPGGFKFAKFMLKISQLVIYEHLKKSNYAMLHCIKPPRNMSAGTSTQKCNLEKEVKLIERETKELLDNFNNNYANTNEKAKEIQRKLEQLNKEIQNSQRHLEEMQLEFNTKYPSYASLSSLEEQLVGLKQQIEKALELGNFVSSSEKLLKYLSSSMVLLGHDKNSPVFDDFAHIITNKKELDLCQFFQDLAVLVEKTAPQLQSPMVSFMQQTKEKIEHFYTKDQIILQHFKSEHERITNILDNLRDCFNGVAKGVM